MQRFVGERWQLVFPDDRPYVFLETPAGERLAELFVLSSLHPLHGRDDTTAMGQWQRSQSGEEVIFSLNAQSAVWSQKTIRLRCLPGALRYEVEVEGQGQLAEIKYFGGYYSGQVRWGSGFFWSGQAFLGGFNPEPTTAEDYSFAPSGGALIDLTGVPIPGKASWFFTPPPYCFALQTAGGWLGFGVEAQPGQNTYSDYRYVGLPGAFHLRLGFEGYTRIDGKYCAPALALYPGDDPYDVLWAHCTALRARGFAPTVESQRPDWWHKPIFCGWGAQCGLAAREGGRAPDYARQSRYQGFLDALTAAGVQPGTLVIDDKWQAGYGENLVDQAKWPDMRGFIARQHGAGRHVLLWLKAWDPEGLPLQECVSNAAGLALACDPTNPRFVARLRESVERMLSPSGYDADGFKIDFSARIPASPGLRMHQPLWGVELMKTYLALLYQTAKQVKPDALVITHTPHPYLADVLDMIRLNDVNTARPVNPAMRHRARVAALACPAAGIETDNWPMPDKAAWRDYVQIQPELGVPSLYFVDQIDATGEPLEDADYQLIRETWARWIAQQEHRL